MIHAARQAKQTGWYFSWSIPTAQCLREADSQEAPGEHLPPNSRRCPTPSSLSVPTVPPEKLRPRSLRSQCWGSGSSSSSSVAPVLSPYPRRDPRSPHS